MQMSGEQRIPASREQVWAALNDPEILKASIPGCESLEPAGDNGYTATVTAKVGPVKAKFAGQVTLSDIDPPNGYTISGEGKGGAAGFARGGAKVRLSDDGDGTLMRYEVDANVGGKLAQLGSRLIDGTARKLADEFFAKFSELAAQAPAAAPTAAPPPPQIEPGIEAMRDTSQSPPAPAIEPRPEPPAAEDRASGEPAAGHRPTAAEVAAETTRRRAEQPMPSSSTGLPTWVWAIGVVVLVVIGIYLFAT